MPQFYHLSISANVTTEHIRTEDAIKMNHFEKSFLIDKYGKKEVFSYRTHRSNSSLIVKKRILLTEQSNFWKNYYHLNDYQKKHNSPRLITLFYYQLVPHSEAYSFRSIHSSHIYITKFKWDSELFWILYHLRNIHIH